MAALERHPGNERLRLDYARMLSETGERAAARKVLDPLVRGSRPSAGAQTLLGTILYWDGDLTRARGSGGSGARTSRTPCFSSACRWPSVTWEPWLSVFDNTRHPHLPLRERRDRGGLAAIARGDYDFYVDRWAAETARFGHPFFLRFAHEMNDPYRYPWGPQNNTKEQFIAAWRHITERFDRAGANNVVWVWSPHVAYEWWELYYPWSGVVDWVATSVLNYGPIAQWSRWWTFGQIFGTKYQTLAGFGKPVMIAELGSLRVGGDRAAWYRDALTDLPSRHSAVKAVLLFNASDDQTVTAQKVEWTFRGDEDVAVVVRDAMASWDPGRRQRQGQRP